MSETNKKLVVKSALRVLQLDDIQFDKSYQREVRAGHKRIVADFNPEALGIPVVAEREDGSLWCVDGRQRIAALTKLGKKTVRAEVFNSKGPEHEAQVFSDINKNRTRLSSTEQFQADLTAGDKIAWAVKECVESCGFKLNLSRSGGLKQDEHSVSSVGSMTTVVRKHGTEPLAMALETIKEAWSDDPMARRDIIIESLAYYYVVKKDTITKEHMVPRLMTTTPSKLIYSAGLGVGGRITNMIEVLDKLSRKRIKKT